MIKLLLILLLSSTYVLGASSSPTFGLMNIHGEPFELIDFKLKAVVNLEAPYKEVQYIATYRNSQDHPLEAAFCFPRNGNFIFHHFEAIFHNKTLVGKIVPREDNHTELDSSEVVNVTIGKLEANETVKILFSVIQPLKAVLNKFFELKLPAITNQEPPFIFNSSLQEWNVQVEIISKKPLSILSNPTHRFNPEESNFTNSSTTYYKALWNVTIPTDKDFIVYFAPERVSDIEMLTVTHPEDPNDHLFLFTALPDMKFFTDSFVQSTLQNTFDDGMLTLQKAAFYHDQRRFPPQYIFMLDRSDSMKGPRFETLKKALIDILQILPERNEIEILSFGNTFEFYKIKGKYPYADGSPSVKEAIEYVKTLEADMGEKNLLKAVNHVTNDYRWDMLYDRAVIILTDGEITSPDEITQLVAKESKYVKTCTLGISSNEVSKSILKDMANAGKCRSEFIGENEDLGEKVFHFMQGTVDRYGFDLVSFFIDQDDKGEIMSIDGCEACSLPADGILYNWFSLDNELDVKSCQYDITIYCEGREIQYWKKGQISNFENATINDTNFYHKIAYFYKLRYGRTKERRDEEDWEIDRDERILRQKEKAIARSIKDQILSEFTQLIAVLQEPTLSHVEAQSKREIQSYEL